jgi:hypothetical protein
MASCIEKSYSLLKIKNNHNRNPVFLQKKRICLAFFVEYGIFFQALAYAVSSKK